MHYVFTSTLHMRLTCHLSSPSMIGRSRGERRESNPLLVVSVTDVAVDLVGFEPTTVRVRAGCSDSTELQIR